MIYKKVTPNIWPMGKSHLVSPPLFLFFFFLILVQQLVHNVNGSGSFKVAPHIFCGMVNEISMSFSDMKPIIKSKIKQMMDVSRVRCQIKSPLKLHLQFKKK